MPAIRLPSDNLIFNILMLLLYVLYSIIYYLFFTQIFVDADQLYTKNKDL